MVNYLAILIAALAGFVIGFIWYMPQVFGNLWMKLAKVSQKDVKKGQEKMKQKMLINLVSLLVMAWVFTRLMGNGTFFDGALRGFYLWLGFVATTSVHSVLWREEPWGLWLLNNGHNLVSIVVMGGILSVWL